MSQTAALEPSASETNDSLSLFERYQPESSMLFASPERTLLACPPFASLLTAGREVLAEQVTESLNFARQLGFESAVVVGAVPFCREQPAHLRVATNVFVAPENSGAGVGKPIPAEGVAPQKQAFEVMPVPAPQVYMESVRNALARFARGELEKVVLARTLEVQCDHHLDIRELVTNLARKNPHGYTFALDLPPQHQANPSRTLLGASPELLVSRTGTSVVANPLAGSAARSPDAAEDLRRAEALLESRKDLHEHALVVEAVANALRPFCKNLEVPAAPSLISTETMWHLSTRIDGELLDASTSSLTLAQALHPTPAVCGYPRAEAERLIRQLEPFERGLFTGMVGWCDAGGDGEWVVTIRCAEVEAQCIRLYAGAGVVAGSEPEKELAETGAKFRTMLDALGLAYTEDL